MREETPEGRSVPKAMPSLWVMYVLTQVAAHDPQMRPWALLSEVTPAPDKILALAATSQSMLSDFPERAGGRDA